MSGVGLLEQNIRFVDVSEKMRNLNVGDREMTLLQKVNSALKNSRFISGTHVRKSTVIAAPGYPKLVSSFVDAHIILILNKHTYK